MGGGNWRRMLCATVGLGVLASVAGGCAWVQLVSVDSTGNPANGGSYSPVLSADGRYVAFRSEASNLVAGDTNNAQDVFVRDVVAGTTTRVSVDSTGTQGNGDSYNAVVSADGRYVVFESEASNLVFGDTNDDVDVFVRDVVAGTTTRVSVDSIGTQGTGGSGRPSVSADGRYVVFDSVASNLVAGDTNGADDVFVRDLVAGTTTRVSVDSAGGQANGPSPFFSPSSISADGRYVVFDSGASNLVTGDTNDTGDVFVRDLVAGTTTRVSVDSIGRQGNSHSYEPAISADSRYVAYRSAASNLVPGDTNGVADVVVRANPVPLVTDVTPSTWPAGAVTSVTITGNNFANDAIPVATNNGGGVAFSNVTVVSPAQITADAIVASDAIAGSRHLWVEYPGSGPGAVAGTYGLCVDCATVTITP